MINNWKKFNEELNKSTYLNAAKSAEDKGLMGLSKRFKQHGEEFGLNPKSHTITFSQKNGQQEVVNISQIEVLSNQITIFGENQDGRILRYDGHIDAMGIQLWLSGNYESLPLTRSDANKMLKLLTEEGLDCSKINTKTFTAEDVWPL